LSSSHYPVVKKRRQTQNRKTTVYVMQHIHCETPGIISECLKTAGISARSIRTFDGGEIPQSMNEAEGLIVMGGPMSVYDHKQFPFLLEEQRLIEAALKDDKPVLGVCLGSQLLAATLGSEVKSGARKEIGWHSVELFESAGSDRLWNGLPPRFTAFHWHGDVFDLPNGSIALAASDLTPCQGFRYGTNAYGFLFHMEVTENIIQNMVEEFSGELEEESITVRSIVEKNRDFLPALQDIGSRVFQRWVKSFQPVHPS
jgi:GMP synthase (glutamine-hydrolysing)